MTGQQEPIGFSDNTFTYSITNVSGTNYRVTQVYGILTVTDGTDDGEEPIDDALIVEMTAEGQEGSEDENQYELGEEATFEISVKNPYDESKTITLAEIEYVTLAQSTFVNVAGGQTISTTATYTVTDQDIIQGSFTNTVTASIGNLTKTAECTILTEEPSGHLTVAIEATSTPANNEAYVLGESILYNITVVNDGNLTIRDIYVTDDLTGDEWGIEALSPGEESTTFVSEHTVTVADVQAGEVLNVATARGTSPNPGEPDVEAESSEDVQPTSSE